MVYYKECAVVPMYSGFGMYQSLECNGDRYDSPEEILSEAQNTIRLYILGEDDLPEGIEDIRGRIHNEPNIVFAFVEKGNVYYGGISKFEE